MTDTEKLIPFPIREDQRLTFDQCVGAVRSRDPESGIIIGYSESGSMFVLSFGQVSRKDALWISEQMKRHAFGEEIS